MAEKIFPLPVKKNKFGQKVAKLSPFGYYRQISEEVLEAFQAATIQDVRKILIHGGCGQCVDEIEENICESLEGEELVDIITCCVTRLEIIGYDADARQKLYQQVNEKNQRRGYLGEE